MKNLIFILIFIISSSIFSQKLIKCNDSISFVGISKNGFHTFLKLHGEISVTENKRVFNVNNFAIQSLLIDKFNYKSNENGDIPILVNYITKETEYFTTIYKSRLDLQLVPIDINSEKKAVLWFFDIPEKFKENIDNKIDKADHQVFISMITENYIYSIASTKFENQSYELIKEMIINQIKSLKYGTREILEKNICED